MKRCLFFTVIAGLLLASCNQQSGEQDSLLRAGDRVQAQGDSSAAISVYKGALERNPANKLPIYLKLGDAYMDAGNIEEAKKTYEEALPHDENDEAKKRLGRLYLATGQADSAIGIFEGVLMVQKDDVKALNGLGVAHDLKGTHQNAQGYYRKALAMNEDNPDIKSNLGLSLAFEGNYDEAFSYLKPIGEAIGATSKQRHNLALVYALSGNQTKAQELYAKDMETGNINENLHAIDMAPKRHAKAVKKGPKPAAKVEPKKADKTESNEDPVEMFVKEKVQ